jgi:AraC-like DNA-binding protein
LKAVWESVPPPTTGAVRVLDLQLAAFAGPLHAHDHIEFTWIKRGNGVRIVGEIVEPFEAGDLVMVTPRVPHVWTSTGPADGPVSAAVVQLQIAPELRRLAEWHHDIDAVLSTASGWQLIGPGSCEVRRYFEQASAAKGLSQLAAALQLLEYWVARSHDVGACRPLGARAVVHTPNAARQRRVDALLHWVRERLATEITVNEAADVLHVSPASFPRAFKRLVGKPFTVYVNDLRVAQACVLLRQSDQPVARIAAVCGFSTLSHFNTQFKLRVRQTPRRYRLAASRAA